MEYSHTPEALEQHGRFVRALARALLRDPGRADDVAQEALARWVATPPEDRGKARAWLSTVVRRLVSNEHRRQARRDWHEEQAARPEALRSAEDESAQAELVQGVVAAVMELPAEQRDTILARYFRGLSATALARESGISDSTVRARERRALARLRERLDREHASRAAWAAGLARLARGGRAARAGLGAGVAAAIGGVLALAAVVLVVRAALGTGASAGEDALAGDLAVPAPEVVVPADPTPSSGPAPARAAVAAGPATEPAAPALTVSQEEAELRGRLVYPDGSPAAGVTCAVMGWEANQERVLLHGTPDDWQDPSVETDEDGVFSIRFVPPRAFQFTLDAKAPDHAAASWRWSTIEPGKVMELGTIRLALGATVTGRIVDAEGEPRTGERWTVYVDSEGLDEPQGRDDVRVIVWVDPATGSFRAEDVMPGANRVEAKLDHAGWIRAPRLVVAEGGTANVDLVYAGADLSRRITLNTSCRPLFVLSRPAVEHVRLLGPGGEVVPATWRAGSSQTFDFDGLGPGPYTVEIDDPRYVLWTQHGVSPGESVRARLEPAAAVRLTVVGLDGAPVQPDEVAVEFHDSPSSRRTFRVHPDAPLVDGIVRLPPGDFTLHVEADGVVAAVEAPSMVAGEIRPLTVELARRSVVSGRVLSAEGEPLGGAEVLLLQPAEVDDSDASPILRSGTAVSDSTRFRREVGLVLAGADGAFEIPITRAGAYVVHSGESGRPPATARVELAAGESRTELELVMPVGCAVEGAVRMPDGSPCSGYRIWIGVPPEFPHFNRPDQQCVPLDADGRYSFSGLPSGELVTYLYLPESEQPRTVSGYRTGWNRIELGTLELAPEENRVQDFVLDTPPGRLTLRVLVDGEPAPGAGLSISSDEKGTQFSAKAGPGGEFGPGALFPGVWYVSFSNPSDPFRRTPVAIPPGGEVSAVVAVQLVFGRLRFLDASGAPLAGRRIRMTADANPDMDFLNGRLLTTDADGRVELTLTEGPYLLWLDTGSTRSVRRDEVETVTVHWAPDGPEPGEVRF